VSSSVSLSVLLYVIGLASIVGVISVIGIVGIVGSFATIKELEVLPSCPASFRKGEESADDL
jgi:hypothetical protein